MKTLIRNIYNSKLAWNIQEKRIKSNLCVPCYHVVKDTEAPHIQNILTIINSKKFEEDIDLLGQIYDFISPNDLYDSLAKNEIPKNKCILTFDDGYRECFDIIYPLLKRKGIPAIFFIVKDLIDNKELCHFNKVSLILENIKSDYNRNRLKKYLATKDVKGMDISDFIMNLEQKKILLLDKIANVLDIDFDSFLRNERPYLNGSEVNEMYANGFGIGAHSINHQRFTEIDFFEQRRQLRESIDFVRSITGGTRTFFAFPFSSFGFKSELYNEFPEALFFDTFKGFQKTNRKIVQRFIGDSNENIRGRLVEMETKKLSYQVRFKQLPNPSEFI